MAKLLCYHCGYELVKGQRAVGEKSGYYCPYCLDINRRSIGRIMEMAYKLAEEVNNFRGADFKPHNYEYFLKMQAKTQSEWEQAQEQILKGLRT